MLAPARLARAAWLRGHLPFLTALALFVFGVTVAVEHNSQRLRREALASHNTLLSTQVRFFEDHFTQSLTTLDSILKTMVSQETVRWSDKRLGDHLRAEIRRVPMLRSLSLLSENGTVLVSSNPGNQGRVVVWRGLLPMAPTPYDPPEFMQFASTWRGRDIADGTPIEDSDANLGTAPTLIPALRTLQVGGKTYYALAAINPDFFLNHYAKAQQSEQHQQVQVRILRLDGTLLLSTQDADQAGQMQHDQALELVQKDQEFGSYNGLDALGTPMLTAFRASRHFPMVILAQLPQAQALRVWDQRRRQVWWRVIPVLFVVSAIALLVYLRLTRMRAEHRQAQAQALERKRLQAILEAMPADVLMLDWKGHILVSNAGWMEFLAACTPTTSLQSTPTDWSAMLDTLPLVRTADREALHEGIRAVRLQTQAHFEAEYGVRCTHAERWLHLIARPLHNGTESGVIVVQIDTTERHLAHQALQDFNRDFEAFLNHTSDWVYFKDRDGRLRFCSQTLAQVTGHHHWRDMLGKRDRDIFPADTAATNEALEQSIFASGIPLLRHIEPYQSVDAHTGFIQTSKWPLFDASHQVVGLFGISRDVTQQQEQHARWQLAATVFTHAREGIIITNAQGTVIDVNDAFTRITGYSCSDMTGKTPRVLQSGLQSAEMYASMWTSLTTQGHWTGELWNRRKDGEIIAVMETISAVRDTQGVTQYYVALCSDITAQKQHAQQLERIAHYDPLTGLPNRVLLADRLQHALAQCQRRQQSAAVIFIDLDGFKHVNDRHGHSIGDALLVQVATRLKAALRDVDTLSRIGGDEFVAILADLDLMSDCVPILDRMLSAACTPVAIGEHMLQVSASIGCTLYPQDAGDADLLMRHADQAMYAAKQLGKNRYQFFDIEQDARLQAHRDSLQRIHEALHNHELCLYYQPKINLRTGKIVGAEALIRWRHPERGVLTPAAFLPTIEHHELAIEVGEWVLDSAMQQMDTWMAQGLGIAVSVNMAARHLQRADFVPRLASRLRRHPTVAPSLLELELLESTALDDVDHIATIFRDCQQLGVRFALDDFGTGYASLAYLKKLPVEVLKIDQSFVIDMLRDNDDRAIVEGVIGLANAFHREVIAEGVETQAHGAILLALGCNIAQGYGIARPMPASDFAQWVANAGPVVQWQE